MPTSWQRTIVSGCDRLLCHPDLRLWTKNFSGNRTIGKVSQTGKRRKRRISTADSTNCSVERPRFWNGPKHAIQTVKWLNTQKQATIPFHPNKTQANGQKLLTVRKKQREAKEKARAESSARSVATQNPKTKKEVRTRRDVSGKQAKGGGERREGEGLFGDERAFFLFSLQHIHQAHPSALTLAFALWFELSCCFAFRERKRKKETTDEREREREGQRESEKERKAHTHIQRRQCSAGGQRRSSKRLQGIMGNRLPPLYRRLTRFVRRPGCVCVRACCILCHQRV